MRVLVCGSRNPLDQKFIDKTLNQHDITLLIEGGAGGVDCQAGVWADGHGVPHVKVPAQWEYYGKKAGPVRNQWMIDYLYPDFVIAFPGGRGTQDMTRRAKEVGIPVKEVNYENNAY